MQTTQMTRCAGSPARRSLALRRPWGPRGAGWSSACALPSTFTAPPTSSVSSIAMSRKWLCTLPRSQPVQSPAVRTRSWQGDSVKSTIEPSTARRRPSRLRQEASRQRLVFDLGQPTRSRGVVCLSDDTGARAALVRLMFTQCFVKLPLEVSSREQSSDTSGLADS